jgi:hypothetical protein
MGIPLKMTFSSRLRRLDRWVRHTRGTFPQQENGRLFHKELAPLDLHVAGDDVQLNALRRAIAQAHVNVAANFMAARPREAVAKIAAVVCWPCSEWSQVCVFFDLDYFRSFEVRDGEQQRWTPVSSNRSLSRELGLRVPVRLRERGYHEWRLDPASEAEPHEGEVWLIGD